MRKNEVQTKQEVINNLRQQKNLITCRINSHTKTIEEYAKGIDGLKDSIKELEKQESDYEEIIKAINSMG